MPDKSRSFPPVSMASVARNGTVTLKFAGFGTLIAVLTSVGVLNLQGGNKESATQNSKIEALEKTTSELKQGVKDVGAKVGEVQREIIKVNSNQSHMSDQIRELRDIILTPLHRRPRRDDPR